MGNVVAYELVSLDGVAEAPSRFVEVFDDVMRENLQRVIAAQACVLLGRRTYDEWADFWPSSTNEPFASFINGVQKHVVTSTAPASPWTNSSVVEGSLVDAVAELRQRPGGDVGIHGSLTLTRSLLAEGLVDELRLVVLPALQGHGRRLYDEATTKRLDLVRSSTSPSGSLLLDFEVRKLKRVVGGRRRPAVGRGGPAGAIRA